MPQVPGQGQENPVAVRFRAQRRRLVRGRIFVEEELIPDPYRQEVGSRRTEVEWPEELILKLEI